IDPHTDHALAEIDVEMIGKARDTTLRIQREGVEAPVLTIAVLLPRPIGKGRIVAGEAARAGRIDQGDARRLVRTSVLDQPDLPMPIALVAGAGVRGLGPRDVVRWTQVDLRRLAAR